MALIFPLSIFFDRATIQNLADVIRRNEDHEKSGVLVPIRREGVLSPLFFVHPIGGGVLCYVQLARHLGLGQPVYGLQASTQHSNDCSIQSMARRYVESIRSVQPHGPYLLGGWSMGGVIAYEMAQQLLKNGDKVALLVLLDSFLFPGGEMDDGALLASFAQDLAAVAEKTISKMPEYSLLAIDEYLHWLVENRVLAQDTDLNQFKQMWEKYRSHYRAVVRYQPHQYNGRVTLLAAESKRGASPIEIWKPLAGEGLEYDILPGDHYSLLTYPGVIATASKIKGYLNSIKEKI